MSSEQVEVVEDSFVSAKEVWKFELLALHQHITHLEHTFGVGPHTISVPRMEPAGGSQLAEAPPSAGICAGLPA